MAKIMPGVAVERKIRTPNEVAAGELDIEEMAAEVPECVELQERLRELGAANDRARAESEARGTPRLRAVDRATVTLCYYFFVLVVQDASIPDAPRVDHPPPPPTLRGARGAARGRDGQADDRREAEPRARGGQR